jgi:hypothetical protein
MKTKSSIKLWAAAIALPITIFLLMAASSKAASVVAHVTVVAPPPTKVLASVECDPDLINLRSNVGYVTCYITLKDANVSRILPNVTLSVLGKPGFVIAEAKPQTVSDYDHDRKLERMVRFNMNAVQKILSKSPFKGTATIAINGTVDGRPFSATDEVRVISPSDRNRPNFEDRIWQIWHHLRHMFKRYD